MVRRAFLFGLLLVVFSLSSLAVDPSTLQLQCTPTTVSVGQSFFCDLSLGHSAPFVAVEGSLMYDDSVLGSVQMTPLVPSGFTGDYDQSTKKFSVSADDPASTASNNGIAHFVFTPQGVGLGKVTVNIDSIIGPAPGFVAIQLNDYTVVSTDVTVTISQCLDNEPLQDPKVKGIITQDGQYEDKCISTDPTKVLERYCDGNTILAKVLDCGVGYSCSDGACAPAAPPTQCLDVSKITTSSGAEMIQSAICTSAGCTFSSTTKLCTGTAKTCPGVVQYTPDTAYANGVRKSLCESVAGCIFKDGPSISPSSHIGDSCSNAQADYDSDTVPDTMDKCPLKGGNVYHDGYAIGCPVGDTSPFDSVVNAGDLTWIKTNPHLFWTSVLKEDIQKLNAFIKGMVENWS